MGIFIKFCVSKMAMKDFFCTCLESHYSYSILQKVSLATIGKPP
jgi:hypothetical protein